MHNHRMTLSVPTNYVKWSNKTRITEVILYTNFEPTFKFSCSIHTWGKLGVSTCGQEYPSEQEFDPLNHAKTDLNCLCL